MEENSKSKCAYELYSLFLHDIFAVTYLTQSTIANFWPFHATLQQGKHISSNFSQPSDLVNLNTRHFYKLTSIDFPLLNIYDTYKVSISSNKPTKSWRHSEFHPNLFSNYARKLVQKLLLSHTTMTLKEDQVHSSWYQTVEMNNVYYHTKFARNQFVNVQMQAHILFFFFLTTECWLYKVKRK